MSPAPLQGIGAYAWLRNSWSQFPTSSCVEWPWSKCSGGYGTILVAGRSDRVHRVTYEGLVGPIPPGFWIDHLCRNRLCYNPAHLEAVTPGENTRRGDAPRRAAEWVRLRALLQTHCKWGHEYDDANTYRSPATGRRKCRACNAERTRRRRKAAVA